MVALKLAVLALAGAVSSSIVLEQATKIPQGWTILQQNVDPKERIRLSIALREPSIGNIRTRLNDPSAGFLTREEALELRKPDQEDVLAVQKWLLDNGISNNVHEHDWIHVHTTVGKAESLLEMKMSRYDFQGKGPILRTSQYSVPDQLADSINFVHPISNFMTPKKELTRVAPPPDDAVVRRDDFPCQRQTTPSCLRQLYGIPPVDPNGDSDIRLGIAGFLEEYANYQDVGSFLNGQAPDIAKAGYNFSVELVNGGENPQSPAESGVEAQLDMEYAMSIGFPSDVTFYSTGGRGVKLNETGQPLPEEFVDNEPYLELFEYLLDKSDDEIPHVVSLSYADDELSVPRPYAERVCSMLGLLACRGTTVLGGSGDGGAAGSRNSSCQTYDGERVTMAVFPASCPWVTAVGAVSNSFNPPHGADFSGGGFSQYFPRESWQDEVVEGYVKTLDGHLESYYNKNMRATPDISAVGTAFETLIALQMSLVEGTSASTPLMAAMIALVNDARVKAGKDVVGWLNGRLYTKELQEALLDVTEGSSMSCMYPGEKDESPGGWPATKGWDAITGLGVPEDFQKFLQVLVEA